jgi:hypothetical protein
MNQVLLTIQSSRHVLERFQDVVFHSNLAQFPPDYMQQKKKKSFIRNSISQTSFNRIHWNLLADTCALLHVVPDLVPLL